MTPDGGTPAETLGRLVRETWVEWAREQLDPKPSWLVPWDDLDEGQREVDQRIGEAVAAAERARIFAKPVTQRFELDDCVLHCAGCQAELDDSTMAHKPGCSELFLRVLLDRAAELMEGNTR